MLAVQATDNAYAFGLLGALGIGTILGALINGIVAARNADAQRKHDLDVLAQRFDHEKQLKHDEDRQRIRDQRLTVLRGDLKASVSTLFDFKQMVYLLQWKDQKSQQRLLVLDTEVKGRLRDLSSSLVLDAAGADLARTLDKIDQEILVLSVMLQGQDELARARSESLVKHSEKVEVQRAEVLGLIDRAIDQCRDTLEAASRSMVSAETIRDR